MATELIRFLRRKAISTRLAAWKYFAEILVRIALIRAKAYLLRNGPIKVLIDNSILGHAVTHETVWISTSGDTPEEKPFSLSPGYAARVPVHSPTNDGDVYREVTYLTGIAELARAGLIELVTSAELQSEALRHPVGRFRGYGFDDLYLFQDVDMPSVDGYHFDVHDAKAEQKSRLARSKDATFRKLASLLPAKSDLDAWHVTTAHRHGIRHFLTMDFKLVNSMKAIAGKLDDPAISTIPCLPSEFGGLIDLRPIPPYLLSYRNARFLVHPELFLPKEKRISRPRWPKGRVDIVEFEDLDNMDKDANSALIVNLPRVAKMQGIAFDNGHAGVKLQYEDEKGRTFEMAMPLGDAMYLLSLLKCLQLELDIPFPDDPRRPGAKVARPSDNASRARKG